MKKSILDYKKSYYMNPSDSRNYGNKDCERLHQDLHLGAMYIGMDNVDRLRYEGLTIVGRDDKEFLKLLYLVSESDPILRDRLELLSECCQHPKDNDPAYKRLTLVEVNVQRYHDLLHNRHQELAQACQTASCESQGDVLESGSDKC